MRVILVIGLLLLSFNALSSGQLTQVRPDLSLYSEYYPNSNATFKGTIVFENGSGTDITEWTSNQKFLQCVRKAGSLFFYDRSGLGTSPPDLRLSSTHPLTAKLASDELFQLLQKRHIKPPYLFVAHSYGAIYAGYFILKYPELVKGAVFVDPVPRNFYFSDQLMQQYSEGVKMANQSLANDIYKKYNGSDVEVIYQLLGFGESKRSLTKLGQINNTIPVIIISSTGMEKEQPLKEDWYTSQQQWLNENPRSKIIQVFSEHFIQLKQPETVCSQIVGVK